MNTTDTHPVGPTTTHPQYVWPLTSFLSSLSSCAATISCCCCHCSSDRRATRRGTREPLPSGDSTTFSATSATTTRTPTGASATLARIRAAVSTVPLTHRIHGSMLLPFRGLFTTDCSHLRRPRRDRHATRSFVRAQVAVAATLPSQAVPHRSRH
jgi:hypothetical protein